MQYKLTTHSVNSYNENQQRKIEIVESTTGNLVMTINEAAINKDFSLMFLLMELDFAIGHQLEIVQGVIIKKIERVVESGFLVRG